MNNLERTYQTLENKVDELEAELKRLNRWSNSPLAPEVYDDMGVFGQKTMSYEQWLQFVLIPRMREISKNHLDLPASSMLATYAVGAFDGDYEADQLRRILDDIDEAVNRK